MKLTFFKDDSPSVIDFICEQQGFLFVAALKNEYNLSDFISKYVISDFCKIHMDTPYSTRQYQDADVNLEEIELELSFVKDREQLCSADIAFWIGYMYRFLYYSTDKSSEEIYQAVPYEKMRDYSLLFEFYEYDDAAQEIIRKEKL